MTDTVEGVPTVWLINEGGHNYEDLKRFGHVMPITTGSVNPFNPGRLLVNIQQALRLAKPTDYVAISGLQVLNGLVMVFWLMKFKELHLLQWSSKKSKYEPRDITRDQIERMVADENSIQ